MSSAERLIALIKQETDEDVTIETAFDGMDLDSLDFMDLVLRIEAAFEKKLPNDAIARVKTVGDFLPLIESA